MHPYYFGIDLHFVLTLLIIAVGIYLFVKLFRSGVLDPLIRLLIRVGTPLNVLVWIVAVWIIPLYFPF